MLRLPTIRQQFGEIADTAEREQMSYRAFIAELLLAECDDRARRRSERRIRAAGFPRDKSLRAFDFDANPSIDSALIHTLATCQWVEKGLPLCLIGDSGTGKSHLLISLGTEAAMKGYRVKYTLATKLVNELVEAADDKVLTKTTPATDASTCSASMNSAVRHEALMNLARGGTRRRPSQWPVEAGGRSNPGSGVRPGAASTT
ncbi:IstB-like ATP-binding domain-containing protein [Nocardia ninae]|uniref:IstB-like ATP-binding domain-containing protein n=1 Tax=Nocardia ninae NBRC 108245 TaxID=1210091 RepID=A0A511MEP4_9NOCA|nr:hypothetical protein NN4_30870 [Nocardia ninae NBRC 108245]